MFRDCQSGGYNKDGTKANEERLTNLILLIAIAYTSSCLKGLKIRKIGQQKYINRLKDKKTKYSRALLFLDWTIWYNLVLGYRYVLG